MSGLPAETGTTAGPTARDAVDTAFREEWARVVATLIRLTGDWALAEECAQDAFESAVRVWPADGVPRRPGAWLTTTARNRALDRLRRGVTETAKLKEVATLSGLPPGVDPSTDPSTGPWPGSEAELEDDRLRLVFTCCHPALAPEARVALTLRTVAGLTVAQIARAFLVSESTMAQRLVRARRRIRHTGIPFRVPPEHQLPGRLAAVLAVVYLLYTTGHGAAEGPHPVRTELTGEAVRLGRLLATLLPDEPEVLGLLALMLLTDARRPARLDGDGDLVVLEHQDRTRWDAAAIAEGTATLDRALGLGRPGPYQVQAAIAALHGQARSAQDTDWAQIALLYGRLEELAPTPVVRLNRAVAVGMAHGALAGLAIVDDLESSGRLTGYHLLPATRADLLRRAGRHAEAARACADALDLAPTDAERRLLARRLAEVTGS